MGNDIRKMIFLPLSMQCNLSVINYLCQLSKILYKSPDFVLVLDESGVGESRNLTYCFCEGISASGAILFYFVLDVKRR